MVHCVFAYVCLNSERRNMRAHKRADVDEHGTDGKDDRHNTVVSECCRIFVIRSDVKNFFYYLPDINERDKRQKGTDDRQHPRCIRQPSEIARIIQKFLQIRFLFQIGYLLFVRIIPSLIVFAVIIALFACLFRSV